MSLGQIILTIGTIGTLLAIIYSYYCEVHTK